MSIKIGKIKLAWFENVYGWVMTGIIGPGNKWFFGYSKQPYPTHDNKDLIQLLQKATSKNSEHFLRTYTSELASALRNSDLYMQSADPVIIQLINVFERFSYGQASLEAVQLAIHNYVADGCCPGILRHFLQQPHEVTHRVKVYIDKLPGIQKTIDKLAAINNDPIIKVQEDIKKWQTIFHNTRDYGYVLDIANDYLEGLRCLNDDISYKYHACRLVHEFIDSINNEDDGKWWL